MSKIYTLILFLFFSILSYAAVRTVNNNNPSPGQYSTIQSAHNASAAGDTIYISGTFFNYGGLDVSKRLVIIGTGHNPQKQVPLVSQIDWITFTNAAAKNTRIYGVNLFGINSSVNDIDSIYVERCKIRHRIELHTISNCSHWYIQGNYFERNDGVSNIYLGNNSHNWIVIRNNVFNGPLQELNYNLNPDIYLLNNIFLYSGNAMMGNVNYVFFYNNIFYRASPSPSTIGCVWQNNLSYQCANNTFPAGGANTGNLANTNPLFVNFPLAGAYFNYAYNFNLQSGSPAKNTGNDGKDIGITGGDIYFEQNGIPSIPQIREFNITSNNNIAPGGSLQINIKSTIKK